MSTQPGVTMRPSASTVRLAVPSTSPTATMRSPSTAMSARRAGAPVPSTSRPLRITRSCMDTNGTVPPLDLGVCVASQIDDVDYAGLCEDLGYSHLWFADSQMIWSDVFATMALAADRTSTIRIGTGVAVAGTRPAPVLAAGMATINRIAPGRVFCGVGSGNTAMRIMGHKPVTIAELDRYLTDLRPLLAGEEISYAWRGKEALTRHLMPDSGFVDVEHRIPLYVSGFGPRSIGLAGAHGDGLVLGGAPTPQVIT